ncbi:MAG: AsmA family protein [Spirochaetota bacterium]
MKTFIQYCIKILSYSGIALCSLVVLVVLILFIANCVLTTDRVSKIITEQIESNLNAKASFTIKHFSLFNGFEIKNFILKGTDNEKPVVAFDTFRLRYSFFPILIGKIKIYEIGLYNPSLYLEEQKGIWNIQRLMKPSESEKEEKEKSKEAEDEKEKKHEITLPVPVEILFGFVLENLNVTVHSSTYRATLKNFSSSIKLHIPPARRIPLNILALTLFDKLNITVNPEETLSLSFISRDIAAGPPLLFTFNLLYNPEGKQLFSNFKCGTYNTPVRFAQKHVAPLNVRIEYDIAYNPSHDAIHCKILRVVFGKSAWISFTGTIEQVNSVPEIQFAMLDSNIRLNEIYQYTNVLLGPKPFFNGSISIFPLIIQGNIHALTVKGAIRGQKVAFATDGFSVTIPSIEIPYLVMLRGPVVEASINIGLPHFVYTVDENRSRDNSVSVQCNVVYNLNSSTLDIQRVVLVHRAPEIAAETTRVEVSGSLILGDVVEASISESTLRFDLPSMAYTLPAPLKQSLTSSPITKPVTLRLKADVRTSAQVNSITLNALGTIPDYSIDDLIIATSVTQKPQKGKINIAYCDVSSKKHYTSIYVKGSVITKDDVSLDVDAGVNVAPRVPITFGNYTVSGRMKVLLSLKGTMQSLVAKGNLQSEQLILSNSADKLFVGPVAMDIPIAYTMGQSVKMPFDSADVMNIQLFKQKANFSIGKIVAPHPSRNIAFEYVKNMHGYIGFNRNIMEIKNLQAKVLHGSVTLKELNFNLADLNPQHMEFRVALNVNDIDIGKLDKPESVRINKDSLLSLNALVVGKNLNIAQDFDISGSINIYKVGEDFANRLFKGINEERGKSKLGMGQFAVDNSLIITGFDFYMDKGLVYPTVFFRKKVLGIFVTVNNEQVRYERIPVVEFFNRVREETL